MTAANALSFRDALIVAAAAALLIVTPLGRHLVAYSGEARMALLARDMLERRVLFHARVEGQHYRNKPPLYPWAVALAAVATAVLTCLLGTRLFGRRAGLWAGLMLITSAGFFAHSQVLLPDMLVAAFTTAAAYAFWRYVSDPAGGRFALVGFYAAVAAGRQIERMVEIQELRDYLARQDRPVALIDRRYWRDFQAKMPPDLAVLEKIPVQGQELYIVRAGAGR